jgi:hypothetical protein
MDPCQAGPEDVVHNFSVGNRRGHACYQDNMGIRPGKARNLSHPAVILETILSTESQVLA